MNNISKIGLMISGVGCLITFIIFGIIIFLSIL